MSINNLDDLNSIHLDVLREIGNIGSGNAATSLSEILFRPVDISVPTISILDYQKATDQLGGPENMVVGMMLMMDGDVSGMIMFLLDKDFAHLTLSELLGQEIKSFENMDEIAYSAMTEVANIMAASYVNAIASMTGLCINISVPAICIDMAGSIMSVPAIHYANISDKIIFISDKFGDTGEEMTSHILMIPDMESLGKIMTNLGIDL